MPGPSAAWRDVRRSASSHSTAERYGRSPVRTTRGIRWLVAILSVVAASACTEDRTDAADAGAPYLLLRSPGWSLTGTGTAMSFPGVASLRWRVDHELRISPRAEPVHRRCDDDRQARPDDQ